MCLCYLGWDSPIHVIWDDTCLPAARTHSWNLGAANQVSYLTRALVEVGGQSREGFFIPLDMMVSDMFTSCNDFEISKKISLYASYAAVYANEPSLDKETEIATYKELQRDR